MKITSKATMDLTKPVWSDPINVVCNDCGTRSLELTLLEQGEAWSVPTGAEVLIRYCKSDGVGGEYDTLPDGTRAWSASGNVLTLALAPQLLITPGIAKMEVTLVLEGTRLTTFQLLLRVFPNLESKEEESREYINVLRFLPVPERAEAGQYLQVVSVDENGKVTAIQAVDVHMVNGATFTPSVAADGTLSWENDHGLENPASVNILGPQGPVGPAPVRGTDYYTEADKQELVNLVLAALPAWEGGSY